MRFRVATKPGLPFVKAWFTVKDGLYQTETVALLKKDLCSRIPALGDESVNAADIQLSIDGFDLLDSDELDVIRENDIVCIAKVERSFSMKRKWTEEADSEPTSQPRKKSKDTHELNGGIRISPVTRDLVTSSPGTSSNDETTSSSSSDSESDDSSSESSSASSDSGPETSPTLTRPKTQKVPSTDTARIEASSAAASRVPHVPPGHGKSSTHSRNARRKLKRQALREQSLNTGQFVSNSSANAVPVGVRTRGDASTGDDVTEKIAVNADVGASAATPISTGQSIASTLKNKNKKNGFKRTMSTATAQHIVFAASTPMTDSQSPHNFAVALDLDLLSRPASPPSMERQDTRPRLIPPSEKQDAGLLPPNLFVTSIELEDDPSKWSRKKKRKQRDGYGYNEVNEYGGISNDGKAYSGAGRRDSDVEILDYGVEESGGVSASVDWTKVERHWASFASVSDHTLLKPDTLIGWKTLDINPSTCTPEMMVKLARIRNTTDEGSFIVVHVRREGEGKTTFGGVEFDGDDGENTEEITFSNIVAKNSVLVV
ncbi:hypothetical protein BD410DRAFT_902954, partial [Rickenella mellea]